MSSYGIQNQNSLVYFISGMWCSTCAKTIQNRALKIGGVGSAEVSYPSKLLLVQLDEKADAAETDRVIRQQIEAIGFGARKQSADWLLSFREELAEEQNRSLSVVQISLVWFLAMWSSMIAFMGYVDGGLSSQEHYYISLASAVFGIPAILIGIVPYARSGLRALFSSKLWTLDFFIFLGGLSATAISILNLASGRTHTYADSGAMVLALLLTAKKVENSIAKKVSTSILFQINQFQDKIRVFKKGLWQEANPTQIRKNDRILIRQGETLPFDGSLVSPQAWVNKHLLSGEASLWSLKAGDDLLAGSIAHSDIEMSVTAPVGSRMIDAWAETALISGSRSHPYAKIFAGVEKILTLGALTGALGIALIQGLSGAGGAKSVEGFFIGVLIFCPCLFASILPLTKQMVHLALLKKGVLLNRTEALFDLNQIQTVCVDKTGTLEAVEAEWVCEDPKRKALLWPVLQELSRVSRHPILRGLSGETAGGASPEKASGVSEIQEVPGQGVRARLQDGAQLWVGKMAGVDSYFPVVAVNQEVWGMILTKTSFELQARKFLRGVLAKFTEAKIEILSGDPNPEAGKEWRSLEPERIIYRGNLRPEEKQQALPEKCLYVGDGLNDTLALAKASVSCRVGNRVLGFAPVDLQLQVPDLEVLLFVIDYAKKYKTILMQTAALAFIYNIIAFTLAAFGQFSPLGAVLAMLTSFTLLLLSALRLLRK